ncbi:MAG: glycosyltransferase [Pyrinomonadaceae bacterium]
MIFVFYFFAAILVLLSVKSLLGGIEYLRFFETELAKPRSEFTPFVTVIAPCRGLDPEIDVNLKALFELDYPAYEIIFVVDDAGDPAVAVINEVLNRRDAGTLRETKQATGESFSLTSASQRLSGKHERAKLVIANKAKTCSQKVENLREAVLHASQDSKAFAFVDSDARPSSEWLRSLIAPLANENVGAATGYRWFIAKKPGLASELRSAWNASIATALGPNTKSNFCWGGSMAIRRDTFDRLNMRDRWVGTLSDDFAVTRAMNEAELPIVFVPRALTASVEDCTFAQMLEFTTRQMKITRVYATQLWVLSYFGATLFNVVMIAALLIAILNQPNSVPFYIAVATLLIVIICSTGKAWLRLTAVKLALPQHHKALKKQFFLQNTLWIVTPAIFLYNCVAASLSRRMTWRGTVYELKSPTETVIIAD